jgi:hypothetical protein
VAAHIQVAEKNFFSGWILVVLAVVVMVRVPAIGRLAEAVQGLLNAF